MNLNNLVLNLGLLATTLGAFSLFNPKPSPNPNPKPYLALTLNHALTLALALALTLALTLTSTSTRCILSRLHADATRRAGLLSL